MSSRYFILWPVLIISGKKRNALLQLWAPSRVTFPNMAEHCFQRGLMCFTPLGIWSKNLRCEDVHNGAMNFDRDSTEMPVVDKKKTEEKFLRWSLNLSTPSEMLWIHHFYDCIK